MRKLFLFCVILALSFKTAHAHNPLSAMYYLEVKEGIGILNISLSQAGLQEALKKHYSARKIETLTSIEYKKLAVRYLKEKFYLNINGNKIELLEGGLKLGNHQTDIKFITNALPKKLNTLDVKIEAFKENDHHQTVFSILLNGKTSKVILSKNNDYETSVKFKENKIVSEANSFNKNYLWFLVLIPVFIISKKICN
ncbi:hypothetical protein [uncultured Lacinutrix sp.]|uniref:hypothetical protein n=1 Tax=uncultured Lacinutrix sp. TaxID=574032 RepID=UPI002625D22C|nr:hypothetical protein [uncultured Lacinutrix sp.]